MKRLNLQLRDYQETIESLAAENATLKTATAEMAAKPALTWRGGLLLIGVGLVVGVTIGVPVGMVLRR